MKRGFVIAVEGPESANKLQKAEWIRSFLKGQDVEGIVLRELYDTYAGKVIRQSLLDPNGRQEILDPYTEMLEFTGARRELYIKQVRPNVERGITPILAGHRLGLAPYQVYGDAYNREEGKVDNLALRRARELNDLATDGHVPDITFVFNQDPRKAYEFAAMKQEKYLFQHKRGLPYYERVVEGFLDGQYFERHRGAVLVPDAPVEESCAYMQLYLEQCVLPGVKHEVAQKEVHARIFALQQDIEKKKF